jgi:hypothetical protein
MINSFLKKSHDGGWGTVRPYCALGIIRKGCRKKNEGKSQLILFYYLFILHIYYYYYYYYYYNSALIKKKLKGILVNHLLLCAWIYFYYELKQ